MTVSMTAFARSETTLDDCQLIWEIRTVNHRYLDIKIKLPDDLRQLDMQCRQRISKVLNRGRVDCYLKLEKADHSTESLVIDHALVTQLTDMLGQIQQANLALTKASAIDILKWPGVIKESRVSEDRLHAACLSTLEQAVSDLISDRKREGKYLGEVILEKITQCDEIRQQLVSIIPEIQEHVRKKWHKRLEELTIQADPERIAQEIALLLTKSDVAEELDRLKTHLDEIRTLLNNKKPIGRSLDFLIQELNREANTLGSKAIDDRMTNTAIELKVLIDQMREQVQNIE